MISFSDVKIMRSVFQQLQVKLYFCVQCIIFQSSCTRSHERLETLITILQHNLYISRITFCLIIYFNCSISKEKIMIAITPCIVQMLSIVRDNTRDRPSYNNIQAKNVHTISLWVVPFFNLDISLPKQAYKRLENTDGHYLLLYTQILIFL